MSKKDISKILTKGTAKQRLLLIAEDVARGRYSKDKILTDHEFNQISDSFKTPNEIKLWNKWKRIDESIMTFKEPPRKTKEHTLLTVANNVREQVIKTATQYLSWSKATEDFMDEEGFNVKTYKEIIKAVDEQVYQRILPWAKYNERDKSFLYSIEDSDRINKIKAKAKYNMAPNLYPIEVDEDIYNYFTKEYLKV
jgi:hypothetical protein